MLGHYIEFMEITHTLFGADNLSDFIMLSKILSFFGVSPFICLLEEIDAVEHFETNLQKEARMNCEIV